MTSTNYGKYYELLYAKLISQKCNEKVAKCIKNNLEDEEVILRLDETILKNQDKVVEEMLRYRDITEATCGKCFDEPDTSTFKPGTEWPIVDTPYIFIIIIAVVVIVGGIIVFFLKKLIKKNNDESAASAAVTLPLHQKDQD